MTHKWILGLSAVLWAAIASTPIAAEKKITRSQLPAPVEKTVVEQSKGATIKGLSTETEHGKTVFEVELVADGRARDITIDDRGVVIEVEEEIPFAALPDVVKSALTKAAGHATVSKVESLTKTGKLVAYEAVVTDGKKSREIQVGPDGKRLAHSE